MFKLKQRPTKHTHKANYRATRTPLNPGVNTCDPEGLVGPAPIFTPVVLL